MKCSWLALILACGLLGEGMAAAELSDESRAQLNALLKESLGDELHMHVLEGRLACVCPGGRQLRVKLPDLLEEEVGEEALEDAAKRLTESCEDSAVDPDTAAVLAEEQLARAQLLVKINEKKGNKVGEEGQHPALLALDAIGGLLMLLAIGWALVVVINARPKAPRRPKPEVPFELDVEVDADEQEQGPGETMEVDRIAGLAAEIEAPAAPPGGQDPAPEEAPFISLPEEVPFGEPMDSAATGFEIEDAATVLVDDKEMVAEVRAKVAAWQQERETSGDSEEQQGEQPASAFAQVASTEPIPAAIPPSPEPGAVVEDDNIPELDGELLEELPAQPGPAVTVPPFLADVAPTEPPAPVAPVLPVPADVAPTEPPSPAAVPAAPSVMAQAAALAGSGESISQHVVCGSDPREVLGKAAANAIELVRSKLFDGSLLIEVMSEGEFKGEIAVNSEYPDRHPVSEEQCILYTVVPLGELMWRPVSGGKFRTMYQEVALEADAKHPWLLVLDLALGQKFHQALLPFLIEEIAKATGGARVPAVAPEQVDRDWMEMAQED